jgi:transposase-like protein
MPKTRPPYPEEFRREAVALIRSGQRSLAEASRSLGVSQQMRHSVDNGQACQRSAASSAGARDLNALAFGALPKLEQAVSSMMPRLLSNPTHSPRCFRSVS